MKVKKIFALLLSASMSLGLCSVPVLADDTAAITESEEAEAAADSETEDQITEGTDSSEDTAEEENTETTDSEHAEDSSSSEDISDQSEEEDVDEQVSILTPEASEDVSTDPDSLKDYLTRDTELYAPMTDVQVLSDPEESNLFLTEELPSEEEYFDEIVIDPADNSITVDGTEITDSSLQLACMTEDDGTGQADEHTAGTSEENTTDSSAEPAADASVQDDTAEASTDQNAEGASGNSISGEDITPEEDDLIFSEETAFEESSISAADVSGNTAETESDDSDVLKETEDIDTLEEKEALFLAVAEVSADTEDASELLADSAYESTDNGDGTLTVEAPYQLQSIIVDADNLSCSYGCSQAVFDPEYDQYVLIYDNEADTMNGYQALLADGYEAALNNCSANIESSYWNSTGYPDDSTAKTYAKRCESLGTAGLYSNSYSRSVKVAIVDSGVSSAVYYSSDFASRFDGACSVVDSYPTNDTANSGDGHGTCVASIILLNSPQNVHVSSVKVTRSGSNIATTTILNGIKRAISQNPDIINISITGYRKSGGTDPYKSIIAAGRDKGIIFTAAAGNDGVNTNLSVPACTAGVLSVSGISGSNTRSSYSNYGSGTDFCAFSDQVCYDAAGWLAYGSGTSFSSPLVAAEIADIMSLRNVSSYRAYKYAIRISTDLGSSGKDSLYGYGKIDLTNPFTASLTSSFKTYTGKAVYSPVVIKNMLGTTVKTVSANTSTSKYTVSYSSNTKVGTAAVTIKVGGVSKKTLKKSFKVIPKKTSIAHTVSFSGDNTLYLTCQQRSSSYCSGYQVQAATDSSFRNILKKATNSGYTNVKFALSCFSSSQIYYIRVRIYKKVNGTNYFSHWKNYSYNTTTKTVQEI